MGLATALTMARPLIEFRDDSFVGTTYFPDFRSDFR